MFFLYTELSMVNVHRVSKLWGFADHLASYHQIQVGSYRFYSAILTEFKHDTIMTKFISHGSIELSS